MFRNFTILALFTGLFSAGCGNGPDVSSHDLELLTSSPWKYEKAGFYTSDQEVDETVNFDALDPQIAGGEQDYTIVFRKDGTGFQGDGKLHGHRTSPDSLPFLWNFQDSDSVFYFQDQYYKVKSLTNKKFIIYADQKFGGAISRYTIVLKH